MAPESLSTHGMELWTQFEEGIDVPRPLRIIKRSGTYTASDGSIRLSEGALLIPRRGSSRAISTTTISAQQEGPFGCLTIHKNRGRGNITLKQASSSGDFPIRNSSDQLMDELLSRVSSASPDWAKAYQEPDFTGRSGRQSSTYLPSQQLAKFRTIGDPQILPYLRTQEPPDSSFSSLSSSDTFRPLRGTEKTSIFRRSLFLFPKSHLTSRKEQLKPTTSALRDLINTPHLKTSTVRSAHVPSHCHQAQQDFEEDQVKPLAHLRENLRRSSTVVSLNNIFRKLSLSRSSSLREVQPLQQSLFDTRSTIPVPRLGHLKMDSHNPQMANALNNLMSSGPLSHARGSAESMDEEGHVQETGDSRDYLDMDSSGFGEALEAALELHQTKELARAIAADVQSVEGSEDLSLIAMSSDARIHTTPVRSDGQTPAATLRTALPETPKTRYYTPNTIYSPDQATPETPHGHPVANSDKVRYTWLVPVRNFKEGDVIRVVAVINHYGVEAAKRDSPYLMVEKEGASGVFTSREEGVSVASSSSSVGSSDESGFSLEMYTPYGAVLLGSEAAAFAGQLREEEEN